MNIFDNGKIDIQNEGTLEVHNDNYNNVLSLDFYQKINMSFDLIINPELLKQILYNASLSKDGEYSKTTYSKTSGGGHSKLNY